MNNIVAYLMYWIIIDSIQCYRNQMALYFITLVIQRVKKVGACIKVPSYHDNRDDDNRDDDDADDDNESGDKDHLL